MKCYLIITPFFPNIGTWGYPYILDQVKALQRNSDYKVVVMRPCEIWQKLPDYEYDGIKVYYFNDYSLPSNIWPNALSDYLTSQALIRKLKSIGIEINDIEVAHAHVTRQGAYANGLKRKNPNIKTIVQHHGFDVMSVTDGKLAKYKFHERHSIRHGVKICNQSDLNVGVSHKTLDYVLKQPGISLKNQYVLYNGVDTSIFYPKDGFKNKTTFTIGCVANFWPLKDQITLIKAIELLVKDGIANLKCIFIGSGATLSNCKQYVGDHNLTSYCEFRKEVQHDKLPDFYRSLDLFVLPSYWEAFGCVYTEAYACGVPFIGIKGQGISEIIPDNEKDNWLINKCDYKKLAALIKHCMSASCSKQNLSINIDIDSIVSDFINMVL